MPMLWKLSILRSIRDKKPDGIKYWMQGRIILTLDREYITAICDNGKYPNDCGFFRKLTARIITIRR